MKVSLYNYKRMNDIISKDLNKELKKTLNYDNDQELGKYVYYATKKIGRELTKDHIIGVSSGTEALQLALVALGIGEGDEVITPPNSYVSTALAISNIGAIPVFVDICKDTTLIDIDKIESSITDKTKAILPVHLHGQMCNMGEISKIAKKHDLFVVEDACQSHLALFDKKPGGHYGDVACYSFSVGKNLSGASNGGLVTSKDKKIIEKIQLLQDPRADNPLLLSSLRTPAYLDWIQLVFLKSKIKHLKSWTKNRIKIAKTYNEELKDLPIVLPKTRDEDYHVYSEYTIKTKNAKELKEYLTKKGITISEKFPNIHLTNTFKYLNYKKGDFPVSESFKDRIINIPINPFLNEKEVNYIINTIKKFFRK